MSQVRTYESNISPTNVDPTIVSEINTKRQVTLFTLISEWAITIKKNPAKAENLFPKLVEYFVALVKENIVVHMQIAGVAGYELLILQLDQIVSIVDKLGEEHSGQKTQFAKAAFNLSQDIQLVKHKIDVQKKLVESSTLSMKIIQKIIKFDDPQSDVVIDDIVEDINKLRANMNLFHSEWYYKNDQYKKICEEWKEISDHNRAPIEVKRENNCFEGHLCDAIMEFGIKILLKGDRERNVILIDLSKNVLALFKKITNDIEKNYGCAPFKNKMYKLNNRIMYMLSIAIDMSRNNHGGCFDETLKYEYFISTIWKLINILNAYDCSEFPIYGMKIDAQHVASRLTNSLDIKSKINSCVKLLLPEDIMINIMTEYLHNNTLGADDLIAYAWARLSNEEKNALEGQVIYNKLLANRAHAINDVSIKKSDKLSKNLTRYIKTNIRALLPLLNNILNGDKNNLDKNLVKFFILKLITSYKLFYVLDMGVNDNESKIDLDNIYKTCARLIETENNLYHANLFITFIFRETGNDAVQKYIRILSAITSADLAKKTEQFLLCNLNENVTHWVYYNFLIDGKHPLLVKDLLKMMIELNQNTKINVNLAARNFSSLFYYACMALATQITVIKSNLLKKSIKEDVNEVCEWIQDTLVLFVRHLLPSDSDLNWNDQGQPVFHDKDGGLVLSQPLFASAYKKFVDKNLDRNGGDDEVSDIEVTKDIIMNIIKSEYDKNRQFYKTKTIHQGLKKTSTASSNVEAAQVDARFNESNQSTDVNLPPPYSATSQGGEHDSLPLNDSAAVSQSPTTNIPIVVNTSLKQKKPTKRETKKEQIKSQLSNISKLQDKIKTAYKALEESKESIKTKLRCLSEDVEICFKKLLDPTYFSVEKLSEFIMLSSNILSAISKLEREVMAIFPKDISQYDGTTEIQGSRTNQRYLTDLSMKTQAALNRYETALSNLNQLDFTQFDLYKKQLNDMTNKQEEKHPVTDEKLVTINSPGGLLKKANDTLTRLLYCTDFTSVIHFADHAQTGSTEVLENVLGSANQVLKLANIYKSTLSEISSASGDILAQSVNFFMHEPVSRGFLINVLIVLVVKGEVNAVNVFFESLKTSAYQGGVIESLKNDPWFDGMTLLQWVVHHSTSKMIRPIFKALDIDKPILDNLNNYTSDHAIQQVSIDLKEQNQHEEKPFTIRISTFNQMNKGHSQRELTRSSSYKNILSMTASQQNSNNPFNVDESFEAYIYRKKIQFDQILQIISDDQTDCIFLQEVDWLDKSILPRYFFEKLKEAGWDLIQSHFLEDCQPLVTLYNTKTLSPKTTHVVFRSGQGRGMEVVFNHKSSGKDVSLTNVHLKFDRDYTNEILDFQKKRTDENICSIIGGDANKNYSGLVGDDKYPTSVGTVIDENGKTCFCTTRIDGFFVAPPKNSHVELWEGGQYFELQNQQIVMKDKPATFNCTPQDQPWVNPVIQVLEPHLPKMRQFGLDQPWRSTPGFFTSGSLSIIQRLKNCPDLVSLKKETLKVHNETNSIPNQYNKKYIQSLLIGITQDVESMMVRSTTPDSSSLPKLFRPAKMK